MPPKSIKKKNAYVLAEKFNPGTVLKDNTKNSWTLGTPIGQGGFGLIYLAAKGENINVNNQNADYVIKIEPKDNGPLFCELHFYANCCKENDLIQFMQSYKLKHLGVPRFIASGICEYKNNKEYRFLVMDKYFKDLQTIFVEYNNKLNENIVLYLTRQILYSLEYIHSKGYSHADIKGANLMLKTDKQVYLVDYGLAYRFSREGKHQNYIQKPEAKHNGTIEYTSRDAHDGVPPSRRGDIEILLYCIIHWLTGKLPWINVLDNKEEVHKLKIKYMNNPKEFIKFNFYNLGVSDGIIRFIETTINIVNSLNYEDAPPYDKIHNELKNTLRICGYSDIEDFTHLISKKAVENKPSKIERYEVKNDVVDYDEMNKNINYKNRVYDNNNKLGNLYQNDIAICIGSDNEIVEKLNSNFYFTSDEDENSNKLKFNNKNPRQKSSSKYTFRNRNNFNNIETDTDSDTDDECYKVKEEKERPYRNNNKKKENPTSKRLYNYLSNISYVSPLTPFEQEVWQNSNNKSKHTTNSTQTNLTCINGIPKYTNQ